MPDRLDTSALKIIEIMGVSTKNYEDALEHAVAKASESIKGITKVELIDQTASVRDGKIVRYEVRVKLWFVVH
ncbi:MAG: dodecin family protein [Actinomycetia bacterium]|nr:dodecin family protein [Actinomycetes bacterium]